MASRRPAGLAAGSVAGAAAFAGSEASGAAEPDGTAAGLAVWPVPDVDGAPAMGSVAEPPAPNTAVAAGEARLAGEAALWPKLTGSSSRSSTSSHRP